MIHSNGEFGFELFPGANGIQPAPNLTSAVTSYGNLAVDGSLTGNPNTAYAIELFASGVCGPFGFGEGETFLGATSVTTDGSGSASISATLAVQINEGTNITATATNTITGATSEFSACQAAVAGGVPGDLDIDADVDLADLAALLGVCATTCP